MLIKAHADTSIRDNKDETPLDAAKRYLHYDHDIVLNAEAWKKLGLDIISILENHEVEK